jgi:hypothetical protein
MPCSGEQQHVASPADSMEQNEVTCTNAISDSNENSDIPARKDQPTSMSEASPSQGPKDAGAAAPFLADGGGNDDVDMQQEPTLTHCVEVKEATRPARTGAIAGVKVQHSGQQRQIKEQCDASVTAADAKQGLPSQMKVKPDNLQLVVSGKEMSSVASLSEQPFDSEGSVAIDGIASVKQLQSHDVLGKVTSESISLQAPAGELSQTHAASGMNQMPAVVRP